MKFKILPANFIPGYLPLPDNFTTVGKPQIVVNQYDSPLDVYSDDTLEEMKEERLTMQNPEVSKNSAIYMTLIKSFDL